MTYLLNNKQQPVVTNVAMLHHTIHFSQDINEGSNVAMLEFIFLSLLLIHFILFTTKTLFELSLGISKFTNFFELGHLAGIFIICVTGLIEIILKEATEIDMIDSEVFRDLSIHGVLRTLKVASILICSLFYPFRLLQTLAHFD